MIVFIWNSLDLGKYLAEYNQSDFEINTLSKYFCDFLINII